MLGPQLLSKILRVAGDARGKSGRNFDIKSAEFFRFWTESESNLMKPWYQRISEALPVLLLNVAGLRTYHRAQSKEVITKPMMI